MIKAPEFLGKTGRKKWHELKSIIPNPSAAQRDMMTMLSSAWEAYLDACELVKKHGQVIVSGDRVWNNPASNTREVERKAIMRISKALGLTADLEEHQPSSPFEDMLQ